MFKNFNSGSMSLEDIYKLQRIVGDHIKEYSMSSIINYKNILEKDIFIPPPPSLVQSCTAFNCVCWKEDIRDKCIQYRKCLKCYNTLNHSNKCNICR